MNSQLDKPVIWQCPVCKCLYSKVVSDCYRCAEAARTGQPVQINEAKG